MGGSSSTLSEILVTDLEEDVERYKEGKLIIRMANFGVDSKKSQKSHKIKKKHYETLNVPMINPPC